MSISTLSSKGQTTIPIEIRKLLNLKAGDRLEYVLDAEQRVILLPVTRPISSLSGALKHRALDTPASVEQMENAIRARMKP
jgi:AbrB family looped-hinge helix DNA binding protein